MQNSNLYVKRKKKLLFDLFNDDKNWVETVFGNAKQHPDIKIFSKTNEGSSATITKTIGIINATQKEILNILKDVDLKTAQKYEEDMLDFKIIKEIEKDKMWLFYTAFKATFPVTNREFTNVRTYIEDDGSGKSLLYGFSVNYKDQPIIDGRVRAAVLIFGWIMEPIPNEPGKTKLTRIAQLDPKGNIPLFVVNLFIAKTGNIIASIKNFVEKK